MKTYRYSHLNEKLHPQGDGVLDQIQKQLTNDTQSAINLSLYYSKMEY